MYLFMYSLLFNIYLLIHVTVRELSIPSVDRNNYAQGLRFVAFCCGYVSINFIHIRQGYFSGTEAIMNNTGQLITWITRIRLYNCSKAKYNNVCLMAYGPFYGLWPHGLTLIPIWISNPMPGKVWDQITYPFLNFNGCTVEV